MQLSDKTYASSVPAVMLKILCEECQKWIVDKEWIYHKVEVHKSIPFYKPINAICNIKILE